MQIIIFKLSETRIYFRSGLIYRGIIYNQSIFEK